MLRWVQSGISAVTGLAEPAYGREAIHPVTDGLENKKTFSTLTADDLKWLHPDTTNVETQTFYFTCFETGYMGFAQIIHSTVIGLYTTAQQTFKIFHKDTPDDYVWTSTKLEDFRIEGTNFYAKNLKVELSEDGNSLHFESNASDEVSIDLTINKTVQGVKFGKDGTTYYGDDINEPWGLMRHVFWPRCNVNGVIKLEEKEILLEEEEEVKDNNKNDDDVDGDKKSEQQDQIEIEKKIEKKDPIIRPINGISMFVMALQGMKPHHAAASWNFMNFISPKHSVVVMDFTTPKSYDRTNVSVGIVTDESNIISCTIDNKINHLESKIDSVGWPVPHKIEFILKGFLNTNTLEEDIENGKATKVETIVKGDLGNLSERVDVMAEIPTFVKNFVNGVVGTKPYIYQFCNKLHLSSHGDGLETVEEDGVAYCEVTFISDISD
ncbi:hypothetical protein PACTADRAFT_74988 [Pachysolen tannophilus NRRL Y-2460]|uniref:Survival factor 1 n=1 Tax=Pachysolen tannophilus NRRL Y-2460 TaxID=669874 RepID=A0A1E4TVJ9_PACTA|nr:hypothetical protein PACTADRAFT_74988 [Pachysolen tannophilus NRRL Y-2460]